MPRHLLPKNLGEHRIACFALYRALLEQCPRLQPLVDTLPGQSNQIQHLIRKQFRRNRHETSHRLVVVALQKGYEAEELLRTAGDGNDIALTKVKDLLIEIEEEREKGRKAFAQNPQIPRERPRVGPYPGYKSTLLQRPIPTAKLSGRRHVPTLSSANSFPFIRIKKNQPEFLSRIFRNKLGQRQRRNDNLDSMVNELAVAATEDKWDQILAKTQNQKADNTSWGEEVLASKKMIEQQIKNEQRQAEKVAKKLFRITQEEEKLILKEKRERKMSKNRVRNEQESPTAKTPRESTTILVKKGSLRNDGSKSSRSKYASKFPPAMADGANISVKQDTSSSNAVTNRFKIRHASSHPMSRKNHCTLRQIK